MSDDDKVISRLIDNMKVIDQGHVGEFISEAGFYNVKGKITCEDGTEINDSFVVNSVFDDYNEMDSVEQPTEDTAKFELDLLDIDIEMHAGMIPNISVDVELVSEYDRNLVVGDVSPMAAACDTAKNGKDGQKR